MKRALFLCLAATLFGAPASARTIGNDEGGYLPAYWAQTEKALRTKEKIIFDGVCVSACTMFLRLPPKQLCATWRVQFVFHAPWGGANAAADAENKRRLMAMYPVWVRDWIDDHGGLTKQLMIMDRFFIHEHMKTCKTNEASE